MSLDHSGEPGYQLIYCTYIVRKGKVIYPRNGRFFRFWVKIAK